MFVTKQIYLPPTFLKLWVHLSDNNAGVVGGHSTTRGGIGIGKEKGSFPLSNNYLDDVFRLKDLLGLEKT